MSSLKRKIGRGLLYGENTVQVNIRVPESKKDEILSRFYTVLNEYIASYSSQIEVVDATIESVAVEKKSNPADILKIEDKAPEWATKYKETIKVEKKEVVSENLEAAKKAKIELARSIVSGVGSKSADIFKPKKLPLEEKYEFEENTSLPDNEYKIAIGSKGIAFTDMYDASFVYLRFGHRTLRFSDRKEFDRFVKTEGVIL